MNDLYVIVSAADGVPLWAGVTDAETAEATAVRAAVNYGNCNLLNGPDLVAHLNKEVSARGCSCGMADYGAPGHDGDPGDKTWQHAARLVELGKSPGVGPIALTGPNSVTSPGSSGLLKGTSDKRAAVTESKIHTIRATDHTLDVIQEALRQAALLGDDEVETVGGIVAEWRQR